MRCAAGVGLVLLVGCNQIFGISASQPWDAPPPPHYARLTWQLATTLPGGAPAMTAAPGVDPTIEFPPLTGAELPVVRIAPLDAPFVPVGYDTSTGMEGRIDIPASFVAKDAAGHNVPWRLEYTIPRGPPHEVQWAPDDNVGHLVVAMAGRLDRPPVPERSGYSVTPTNPPTSYVAPRVWTTGLWTDGVATASGATVDYDLSNAKSLSGGLGQPDAALDRAFVVDFAVDPGTQCLAAIGSAVLASAAVTGGTHSALTPMWDGTPKRVIADPVGFDGIDRLNAGLGNLHGSFNANGSGQLFGYMPSKAFPGLTGSSPAFSLPIPVMQTLLKCPYNTTPLPDTAQPAMLVDFSLVLHAQVIANRPVAALGVNLLSGIETVLPPSPAGGFTMAFPARIPTVITLSTPATAGGPPLDLSGGVDQLSAGAPTGTFTLDFVPEPDTATLTGLRADYYDVILHRITGGMLTDERIYTVTSPEVRIDASVLVRNADYVFEIRSYKGHALAASGDFTVIDYPYGSAVVFSDTFKTP